MQGDGGLPVDYAKAIYWNDLGAKQGHAEGLNNLGWIYENGLGVKKNYGVASDLYRDASKNGNKEATERLSALLAKAPTPQDVENQKLDAVIADLEVRYPVLNDKSPKFNQKIVDEVLVRQKAYIAQGQQPSNALQMAVEDMTHPQAPTNRN
jgi:TPR repeat protein